MYHYLYKITNLINGHFYYGIHSTNNLDDGYMGSGTCLHEAYEKYGIENFQKEILKFKDTREEISNLEREIVNIDLVKDQNCYNIRLGGDEGTTLGTATMKDKNGNIHQVPIGSNEYYNMVGSTKGMITVYDKLENKNKSITKEEYDNNLQRYSGCTVGKVTVLINGKYKQISREEYSKGNYQTVWSGRHHSDETKQKISQHHKETGFQKGEKNSQFGTCWITKNGENKKIKNEEIDNYLNDGWAKGRFVNPKHIYKKRKPIKSLKYHDNFNINNIKNDINQGLMNYEISEKYNISLSTIKYLLKKYNIKRPKLKTCWINNGIQHKNIKKKDLQSYLLLGWVEGMLKTKKEKRYWFNKNNKSIKILESEIDNYIKDGWIKGRK